MSPLTMLLFVATIAVITTILNLLIFLSESKRIRGLQSSSNTRLSQNQVETHIHNNRMSFLQITIIILTGLAVVLSSYYSFTSISTQVNLANEQIKYLNTVSSQNWANIEIDFRYPPQKGYLEIQNKQLTNAVNQLSIGLVAINSGKVDSGLVKINSYKNDEHLFARLNPSEINISAQSGKYLELLIKQTYCQPNGEDCNLEDLPHGMYNLTLEFRCDFCSPESRIFEETISLCIYKESNSECEEVQ